MIPTGGYCPKTSFFRPVQRVQSTSLQPGSSGRNQGRRVAATEEQIGQAERSSAERKDLPPRVVNPEKLKLQKVERLGSESWGGVASVDRDSSATGTSLGKAALLVAGDSAALAIFLAIGKASHGSSLNPLELLKATAPFLIGWLGAAALQNGFGAEAQGGNPGRAFRTAAQVWITGIPVGLVLRGVQSGHLPPASFALITMATTFLLLVGWRSLLASVTPDQETSKRPGSKANKKGNPLEFLRLLGSLTNRW